MPRMTPQKKDILDAKEIAALLEHPMNVRCYPLIDSTNTEAKRLIVKGVLHPDKTSLLCADCQTAGRGRRQRTFCSPSGGLYLSLVIPRERIGNASPVSVTTAAAVAVARAIHSLTGETPAIKWVNDLLLHEKKICGILTEAVNTTDGDDIAAVIVGIGINLSSNLLPQALSGIAGALHIQCSRVTLAAAVADSLLSTLADPDYMTDYRRFSCVIGRDVQYEEKGVLYAARAIGVENDGGLEVEHPDGTRRILRTGEITLRLAQRENGEHMGAF